MKNIAAKKIQLTEGNHFQKMIIYNERNIDKIPQLKNIDSKHINSIRVISKVLPFRVNQYVLERLIDWTNIPNDPIFQLTFPQPGMLSPDDFKRLNELLKTQGQKSVEVQTLIYKIRHKLNPHPAEQMTKNVPKLLGQAVAGLQHKYKETVLFFPSQGQVCHSYCSFCFRWAQFIGDKELQFATKERDSLLAYLKNHQEVSNLLITGGDPMVMKTKKLVHYLESLVNPEFDHIQTIRIGSKALTYWPFRFLTDPDADELIVLFEKLIKKGKQIAFMAHINHWQELMDESTIKAIKRLQSVGVVIRSQAPLLKHINDSSDVWQKLWNEQEKLSIIPYYMFVERNTGASRYFELPLAEAYKIYREAFNKVSGLSRTARGPSMSTTYGKVEIQGITDINQTKVFVLRFLQARNPKWVQQPFFAKFDPRATWFTDLKPAFSDKFFFMDEWRDC